MEKLKQLLNVLDENSSKDEIVSTFNEIAETLMTGYHIEKGTQEYYFLDIEFYFCNKNHPDLITYPRIIKEGKWFFHQSGMDLTFNSIYTPHDGIKDTVDASKPFYFGGILVQKILKKDTLGLFNGPQKCVWELFDVFDALNPTSTEIPRIVRNKKEIGLTPKSHKRHFSYTNEKKKKKYKELTEMVFCGNPLPSFKDFSEYLNKEYAYQFFKKDELESELKNL